MHRKSTVIDTICLPALTSLVEESRQPIALSYSLHGRYEGKLTCLGDNHD